MPHLTSRHLIASDAVTPPHRTCHLPRSDLTPHLSSHLSASDLTAEPTRSKPLPPPPCSGAGHSLPACVPSSTTVASPRLVESVGVGLSNCLALETGGGGSTRLDSTRLWPDLAASLAGCRRGVGGGGGERHRFPAGRANCRAVGRPVSAPSAARRGRHRLTLRRRRRRRRCWSVVWCWPTGAGRSTDRERRSIG